MNLKSAQSSYDEVINKISRHGGPTFQVETLKILGAKSSKKIDPKYLPSPEEGTL